MARRTGRGLGHGKWRWNTAVACRATVVIVAVVAVVIVMVMIMVAAVTPTVKPFEHVFEEAHLSLLSNGAERSGALKSGRDSKKRLWTT